MVRNIQSQDECVFQRHLLLACVYRKGRGKGGEREGIEGERRVQRVGMDMVRYKYMHIHVHVHVG